VAEGEFEYGGRSLTLRSWRHGSRLVVAAFDAERQVSFSYGCDDITAGDLWPYERET